MKTNHHKAKKMISFKIYAENHRDGTLIIKNIKQGNYCVCTVYEIMNNYQLLCGFSEENISFIRSVIEFNKSVEEN
jgi:hypothetical protein